MMSFVLVALAVFGAVYSTPVEKVKRQADRDFEFLPINPMRPTPDGQMDFGNPRFLPQDFFGQFADLANMLRAWFNRRPFFQPDDFDVDDDEDFGRLPPNYDNSTFTTKVVNGSIITVNETIKKHESNDSSFVWHVKVVQIRPENDTFSDDLPAAEGGVDRETETVHKGQELPSRDDSDNDVSSVPRVRRSSNAAKLQ